MQYPLISEYLAAIRDAKDNLDKLSHLVPVLDKYGEPYRSSGAFAVVFKMKDEQTGKCYALKCFTEDQEGRAEAYHKIAEELEFVDSPYITSVKYLENELFVDSNCENEEFPVLLMDWIEGETMETYIADNYTDNYAMSMLCYRFCKMAAWLRSQSFAHGDIKPDNIMVRPDGTLTLVDYDGMFVPAMKGQKSPTIGTKDFSHPLRTIDDFDETIDDFALASIALSLKAISLDPSLLQNYGASDCLLFSAADYLDLSKSNTFTALQGLLADEEARTLLSMFLLASAKKDLSMCSFRLFDVQKPKEEEVWSTEVTKEDLKNAVEDEFGVKYSKDWKRLLKAPSGLKGEYSIRKGVKVIGNGAFWCCRSLTKINIPNSVTNIGNGAFLECSSLSNINIPSSVVNMNGNPFFYWNGDLHNDSKAFIYEHQVLFNKDKTTLIAYRSKEKNYIIPNSVTNIGDFAFGGYRSLTNINIPNSVTSIGNDAFGRCYSLTSINIPDGVTNIGHAAFYKCESLTSINIPDGVTNIGDYAFLFCKNILPKIKSDIINRFGEKIFE
ncbi:serine/threonine protein kinase [Prevotella sp. CAG:520]|nr:serine/threonine protein kinase [Prevotella sp. CAG:520]